MQKWTYGYDANGNRTSYTQLAPAVSITYTYTGGNEIQKEMQGSTTTTFTFDGNGNLTGQTGGQSLAYIMARSRPKVSAATATPTVVPASKTAYKLTAPHWITVDWA